MHISISNYNPKNPDHQLYLAVLMDDAEKTKNALAHGGDVNFFIKPEEPLFYLAVKNNQLDVARIFLENGANANQAGSVLKIPALCVAAQRKYSNMVNLLLEFKADPNQVGGDYHYSPLHLAILNEDDETAKSLIQRGAKVDIKNAANHTAADIFRIVHQSEFNNRKIAIFIDQNTIINNISLFLAAIGESLPDHARKGLCQSFSTLLMRANLIGKQDEFFNRLGSIGLSYGRDINEMANAFLCYHDIRRKLSEQRAPILKKSIQEHPSRGTSTIEIQKIRAKHYATIELDSINEYKKENNEDILNRARDLYVFISSLLFAQAPGEHIGLYIVEPNKTGKTSKRKITQADFLDIINVIPPDESSEITHYHQALKLTSTFTTKELISTLQSVTQDGDIIVIQSRFMQDNHCIYFKKNGDQLFLYDSNSSIEPSSTLLWEKIVIDIQNSLGKNLQHDEAILPLTLNFFSKSNSARSTVNQLIHQISINRKRLGISINATTDDGMSALHAAALENDIESVNALVNLSANINQKNNNQQTPVELTTNEDIQALLRPLLKNTTANLLQVFSAVIPINTDTLPQEKSLDYFKTLGINPGATQINIRQAYLKLAKARHPDKNSNSFDANEKFRQLDIAYKALFNMNIYKRERNMQKQQKSERPINVSVGQKH